VRRLAIIYVYHKNLGRYNMFENIPFEQNKTASPLIWKPPADVQDTYPDDTVENMMHTNCWISCEVDIFHLPLIPEETRKTMLYTQAAKIAHEVGIHDINNFNYLFKKKLGQTPIRYRNSADILNWD